MLGYKVAQNYPDFPGIRITRLRIAEGLLYLDFSLGLTTHCAQKVNGNSIAGSPFETFKCVRSESRSAALLLHPLTYIV
jgi:hypothetical protein